MSLRIVVCFFWVLVLCKPAQGRDPQWFQRRMSELDRTLLKNNESEKIESLGKFLGIARYGYGSMDDEQRAIFDKAQSALLAIPGHATYYQDQIEKNRELAKKNESLPEEEKTRLRREGKWVGAADYDTIRNDAFIVLGFLPSPQAVAVLGNFLEDPEGRDGINMLGYPMESSDASVTPCNAGCATQAIRKLGIEKPPFREPHANPHNGIFDGEIDAWKDWWNEVKAGRRTYRFTGSSVEYGPDGPIRSERVEKGRKRTGERENSGSSAGDSSVSSTARMVALILGGVAVIASLVWYFRKAVR